VGGEFTIVAHAHDATAAAVASVLRARCGREAVRWIGVETLARATRWQHRIEPDGTTGTVLQLPDAAVLHDRELGVVFNRAFPDVAPGFSPTDQRYAVMEMHALLLSWLTAVPGPVVNRPSPRGLTGTARGPIEWHALAARAGLPVRCARFTTSARAFAVAGYTPAGFAGPVPRGDRPTVLVRGGVAAQQTSLVAGNAVVGMPDPRWREQLKALSEATACPLLDVTWARLEPGAEWVVTAADPWVDATERSKAQAVATALLQVAPHDMATARTSVVAP
jgi:hypothetical protein